MKAEGEILPLTGLRFVAAFYVFLLHMQVRWEPAETPFFANILGQGGVGMSLFFVLSGFVLTYRYGDGPFEIKDYLINRFARIYPIYFVIAVIMLPWFGLTLQTDSFGEAIRSFGQAAFLVFADTFLLQAWFPRLFHLWNNTGSWSISVEAFFYLMFPLILPYLVRLCRKRLVIVMTVAYALAVIPGVSAKLFIDWPNIMFYSMPIFRLPEFVIGICVCLLVRHGLWKSRNAWWQAAALAVLLVYLGFAGNLMHLYIGHNWIVLPVIAFVIGSLSTGGGWLAAILSTRVFLWLGKISYSFYSFQLIILLSPPSYHSEIVAMVPALADSKLLLVAALAGLVIVSGLAFHLIEDPARRLIRRLSDRRRGATAAPNAV